MADISKITTLDGTTYNLKDTTARYYLPYGVCDTAAATAAKTVSIDGITAYTAGMTIAVKFTYANSKASPTLNVNSLGAKSIYQYGTTAAAGTAATTGWQAGAVVILVYDGTGWQFNKGYNTNDNTIPNILYHYNNILAKADITADSLICGDSNGYQKVAAGVTFDITYPLIWCTGALSSGSSAYATMFFMHYDKNLGNIKSGYTSTKNKIIYLVVTVSGNTCTVATDYLSDTLPSSDDGKVYIVLGRLGNQSTGANYFVIYPNHEKYWYKDGAVRPYGDYGNKVNGHTVNSDVPANAVFTDTKYTANTSKLVTTTVPNVTSVGSAPTLGTAIAADDITAWDAGSTPTLGTAIPADDITAWDAGSTPTLGTAIPADDITAWTTNTPTSISVALGTMVITSGSAASLSYTAKSIPNVTSVGSVPSLSYTAKSIPNVTSVGSVPSLSYTARSIPNVTSVGSAPTLGTAITVATGSLASNGGGASVATGITAS